MFNRPLYEDVCLVCDRVPGEKSARRVQTVATENPARLVQQETRDSAVRREIGETGASLGRGDSRERSGPRVHPASQEAMEILASRERAAYQDQRDLLETQYE